MSKVIDEKIIARIAELAHIAVREADLVALASDLESILEWVGQLDEVDCSEVEPLAHPMQLAPVMREDIPAEPISKGHALDNAPQSQSGFFVTPKTNE